MKILQIIPSLTDGGAERFVVDLCNELVLTEEVCVCVLFPIDQESGFFKEELSPEVKLVSLHKKLGFDIAVFGRLKKMIKQYNPDLIHTHLNTINYLMPLLVIPWKKYKVVHTVHNDASKEITNENERKLRLWFYQRKKVYPVTISEESERSFHEIYPKATTAMIYNGTRMPQNSNQYKKTENFIKQTKESSETKVFVHIGRVTPQKNHIMLVNAFQKLLENGSNAILIMIGGARNTIESQAITKELEKACNKNIIWLGGNQPATDYLKLADFFCLSSIYEGMPISLIEAFACGCVPICTPVGGIPEMIKNAGILSDDITAKSYYISLLQAYNLSDERVHDCKEKMKKLFNKKYGIEYCTENYKKLYYNLIS